MAGVYKLEITETEEDLEQLLKVLDINAEGNKELLGLWVGETL
jgi:transposase-like protein